MVRTHRIDPSQVADEEWITFPGGELEGRRPKTLCRACRARARVAAAELGPQERTDIGRRPLCFQCYRAGLERERALAAAGQLFTGSDEHIQEQLPLEPVNRPRLDRLRAARSAARARAALGAGRFVEKRREAQIDARRQLAQIADGLSVRSAPGRQSASGAQHAAELQLPASWLPFVVSR